jgi:hypothetical protein
MAAEAMVMDDPLRLETTRAAMERTREVTARGRHMMPGILEVGGVGDWEDAPGHLRSVAFAARLCRTPQILDAFRALALRVEGHAGQLMHRPCPNGQRSFLLPLQQLAERYEQWRRGPEEWRPRAGKPAARFAALTDYLLPREEAARFEREVMQAPPTRQFATWFAHLDRGANNRPDSPRALYVTKKIAAHLAVAPEPYDYIRALRWGQVFGMGGDARLARAVDFSRLGWQLWEPPDEEFWAGIILWLAQNPTLERAQVTPIIDFVYARRYGDPAHERLPDPTFTMKGRTPLAVQRLIEEWHAELASLKNYQHAEFPPSGLLPGRYEEEHGEEPEIWTIEEILDSTTLVEEGRRMHHCVATYLERISKGKCSIWSMKVRRGGLVRRAVTVQVNPGTRRITQCRGRTNRMPKPEEKKILKRWARENSLLVESY